MEHGSHVFLLKSHINEYGHTTVPQSADNLEEKLMLFLTYTEINPLCQQKSDKVTVTKTLTTRE